MAIFYRNNRDDSYENSIFTIIFIVQGIMIIFKLELHCSGGTLR